MEVGMWESPANPVVLSLSPFCSSRLDKQSILLHNVITSMLQCVYPTLECLTLFLVRNTFNENVFLNIWGINAGLWKREQVLWLCKLMSGPVFNSLVFHLAFSDQSTGLLDPNQGLIIGKSLFDLFLGIKQLPVKLIFLFLVVKK